MVLLSIYFKFSHIEIDNFYSFSNYKDSIINESKFNKNSYHKYNLN